METAKAKTVRGEMLIILALAFSMPSASLAAEGIWTEKAGMPTARMLLGACAVDGKIYAIGGGPAPHMGSSAVEEYDPETDTWTRKAPMPTPRAGLGVSVVNGKIYAIGGGELNAGVVEEYDPQRDTWVRKSNMPTVRGFLSVNVVNGKIYAIGGAVSASGPAFRTVEEYNPETDTWARRADLPEPRYLHTASVVDGKIYIIAGSWQAGTASRAVYAYDPSIDTWERKADAPTARSWQSASSGAVNGRIYVIGGDAGPPDADVEEYDPATDTWTTRADMPTPRGALSTTALNDKIYVIGGTITLFNDVLSTVEEYYPNPLVVDFNGDGIVDIKDILRLIESWGQDDPPCDVAPRPSGDGVVDALDLELLMSYWERPVDDPTLIAHWALDEADGDVAYDSAGLNDAYVAGNPSWQPDGGQVNGAVQLDGVDDCILAGAPLNPADGSFSLFVWVKGGAPGQGIISEPGGPDWLSLHPQTGNLMTELTSTGRNSTALMSQAVIDDESWHRIGLVWDGLYRTLYVDGLAVAQDTKDRLQNTGNGFYIGTGKAMTPGTYFSGLIDDVRIYNRAVKP